MLARVRSAAVFGIEAADVSGVGAIPVATLHDALEYLNGERDIPAHRHDADSWTAPAAPFPAPLPAESRPAGPLSQRPVSGRVWDRPRRVIAKVEHHPGELLPRVGFIVTTLTGPSRAAEQWIKEGKAATHWTRLSGPRFRANEVRLLLGVTAYYLGNLLHRLACLSPFRTGP